MKSFKGDISIPLWQSFYADSKRCFCLQVPMEQNLEVANFPLVKIPFLFLKICYYWNLRANNDVSHYTFRLWGLWCCWRSWTSRKRWPWLSCWNWCVCDFLINILLIDVKGRKYHKISLMLFFFSAGVGPGGLSPAQAKAAKYGRPQHSLTNTILSYH